MSIRSVDELSFIRPLLVLSYTVMKGVLPHQKIREQRETVWMCSLTREKTLHHPIQYLMVQCLSVPCYCRQRFIQGKERSQEHRSSCQRMVRCQKNARIQRSCSCLVSCRLLIE